MVRFAVTPPPKLTPPPKSARSPRREEFRAQLALARVHPFLAPVDPVPGGFALDPETTRGWFELPTARGFAGYGLARALRVLLDVLSGLSALHDTKTDAGARFVHGEVAPALLRVDAMGIGRVVPLAAWHRLAVGAPVAPERQAHVAPERLLGDVIDPRADVFSCGVLLWEALAGRRLFDSDSAEAIVARLLGSKLQLPELPPELGWAVPLKAIAMCALSVDPAQRFEDCAELSAAIEQVAGHHVASHEEVRSFFGARDGEARAVGTMPNSVVSHNSSLSALVSPVPRLAETISDSESPESAPSESTRALRMWTAAALLTVTASIGVGAMHYGPLAHALGQGPSASAARAPSRSELRPRFVPPPSSADTNAVALAASPSAGTSSPSLAGDATPPLPSESAEAPSASASAATPPASEREAPSASDASAGAASMKGLNGAQAGKARAPAKSLKPTANDKRAARPVVPTHEDAEHYGI